MATKPKKSEFSEEQIERKMGTGLDREEAIMALEEDAAEAENRSEIERQETERQDKLREEAIERSEFPEEEVRQKMSSGLTRVQAIEALRNQAEHDRTKPHDKLPAPKEGRVPPFVPREERKA